jgi:hypothetical protein
VIQACLAKKIQFIKELIEKA